jgi:hypothetical protein
MLKLLALSSLAACMPASSGNELQAENEALQAELDSMTAEMAAMESQLDRVLGALGAQEDGSFTTLDQLMDADDAASVRMAVVEEDVGVIEEDLGDVEEQVESNVVDIGTYADITTGITGWLGADLLAEADLSQVLDGFPTLAELDITLGDYPTSVELTEELKSYPTVAEVNTTLTTTLSDYALSSVLNDYTLSSTLTKTLNDYALTSALTKTLSDYALTATLEGYTTTSSLTSTLGDYVLTMDMEDVMDLMNFVSVDEEGDVWFAETNLHVVNGSGSTSSGSGDFAGKGNIFIGYNTTVVDGYHSLAIGSNNDFAGYGSIVQGSGLELLDACGYINETMSFTTNFATCSAPIGGGFSGGF